MSDTKSNASDDDAPKIKRVERPKKKEKNVFTYMQSTAESQGPKSLLYRSIAENRKIRVWTRSHTYVRSICTGYLIAFDKFWNLAMIDVDEVYKVPMVKKSAKDKVSDDQEQSISLLEKRASEIAISTDMCGMNTKGFKVLHRHISQIIVRGDNVVMVSLVD